MNEIVLGLVLLAVWILLQIFVFPRLGVPT